jgi:hypothetical protein
VFVKVVVFVEVVRGVGTIIGAKRDVYKMAAAASPGRLVT